MLRVLVVDDEPLAIDRMRVLLTRIDGVALVATATSGADALRLAVEQAPDLCLLDIGMPEMDGMAVARALAGLARPPKVVFVTAFDDFAVAAFDVDAVDYLVKPVEPKRLARAIDRARAASAAPRPAPSQGAYITEFWASDRHGLTRVTTDRIDRITAERDYMRIHAGPRSWLIDDSLTRLETALDPARFVRLHRGAIVRRDFVTGLRYDDRWIALLADGGEQQVGRSYADNARALAQRGRPKGR